MLKTLLVILFALIFLLLLLVFLGGEAMTKQENRLVELLKNQDPLLPTQSAAFENLPEPVKSYFAYALGEKKASKPQYVKVQQTGTFRFLNEDSKFSENEGWKKMTATQHFSIGSPGFYWFAKIKMNALLWMRGWDSYDSGKGNMRWKVNSLVTVVNAKGEKLDEGSLYRYLAEAVWFPTALLPENGVVWKALNGESAQATLTDGSSSASVIFYFNQHDQIYKMSAKRFREVNGEYIITGWHGHYDNYQELNGFRVPLEGTVSWDMPQGKMEYVKIKVDEILYQ